MNTLHIAPAAAGPCSRPAALADHRTEVLVVGAGPTGLMLANQLQRRDVRTLIVDRHAGPAMQSRAMAVHARTLEIYDKLGVAGQAVELGRVGTGGNIWAEGRKTSRIPLGDIGQGQSPFPYVLMLGQDDNERILGRHLDEAGLSVQWNTELLALEQATDSVTATLKLPDGSQQTVRADYVAGCDGGRSAVRELNGIGFPGAPYEHTFFVADTEATGEMVPDELNIYLWRDGFHLFFPMRGTNRWRVIGILPQRFRGLDDVNFDMLVPSIRQEAGAALTFHRCDWFSTYHIHHRCTERFRDRRCLLAGDAAHVHSPMGGQGMNTGLQDAYNLAWKLALVVKGRAADSLLDSYELERMRVAKELLASTDRAFTLLVSENRLAGIFRTKIAAKLAAFALQHDRAQKLAFRTLSMTGICYPASPLSRKLADRPKGGPRAGDRFPWLQLTFNGAGRSEDLFARFDDTRFNLLVIGQPGPAAGQSAFAELVDVHVASGNGRNAHALARFGIPGKAFYLLRPDGHVALAGQALDIAAIDDWFVDAQIRTYDRPANTDEPLQRVAQYA
jgi:2-polyprenyl-6-methoxyphenol hydroxylase-like FAD-dependent oxidoreductase